MKIFKDYHPMVLIIYFISVLLIAMFLWNPVILGITFLGGTVYLATLIGMRKIISDIGFYIPLLLLITITNPLFSHNGVTPLFFMNGNAITLEAILYGVAIGAMIIGVMIWSKCYSHVMTSDKFIYLCGRIWPKLSLILSMTLRFIPEFKRQIHKVSRAQKAMGLYSQKSYIDRIRSGLRVMSVMIGWSLENGVETSNGMKARGYGLKGRTNYSIFHFKGKDGILLGTIILLVGTIFLGISFGTVEFQYYPTVGKIESDIMSRITYLAYGVLAFLPCIIELEETIRWKYYISKI